MTVAFWTTIGGVVAALITGVGGLYAGGYKARLDAKASEKSAEHVLIDQLQEELARYRERTDSRLDELETLVRSYRGFIGVQRDHMAEHGVPLPPWPPDLPR